MPCFYRRTTVLHLQSVGGLHNARTQWVCSYKYPSLMSLTTVWCTIYQTSRTEVSYTISLTSLTRSSVMYYFTKIPLHRSVMYCFTNIPYKPALCPCRSVWGGTEGAVSVWLSGPVHQEEVWDDHLLRNHVQLSHREARTKLSQCLHTSKLY